MIEEEEAGESAERFGWHVFRLKITHDENACDGGTTNCKVVKPIGGRWITSNDPEVIAGWDWSEANAYGIDCGKSGLVVVDVDPGGEWNDDITRVHSTGRGYHYFYEDVIGLGNTASLLPGVDTRGIGGMVIGPGSWHPHGDYTVVRDVEPSLVRPYLTKLLENRNPAVAAPETELPELSLFDALSRLEGVYRRLREATEGSRNNTLNVLTGVAAGLWVRLSEEDQDGELSEDRIRERLAEAAAECGLRPDESQKTIESGWRYGLSHPMPDNDEIQHAIFDSTPVLQHIRTAAHSRMVGSGSLLCCVLGRVLAEAPPSLVLPPVIGGPASLNLAFAFVGASGGGKSGVVDVSDELLGVNQGFMEIGPGSGEGLIDAYMEEVKIPDPNDPDKTIKVKQLVDPPSRIMDIDEIGRIGAIKGRDGSTLFSMIRTALTGGALKTANAAAGGRVRALHKRSYRLTVFAGVQPELSDILLDDVNAGTPQRFVWVSVMDKTLPEEIPEWPGELGWSSAHLDFLDEREVWYPDHVKQEVRQARWDQVRNGGDPFKGHLLLTRLKVATALALLHKETEINDDWWRIAGLIIEWSMSEQDKCRRSLAAASELENERRGRAAGRSEIAKNDVMDNTVMNRARNAILKHVQNGEDSATDIKRRLSTKQRDVFDEVLDKMVSDGVLRVSDIEYRGQTGRSVEIL